MKMQARTMPASLAPPDAESARPRSRHAWPTIALHWSTVLAIVIATVAVLWREAVENDALRTQLLNVHRQAGLFVMLALALRVAVRLSLGMANFAGPLPKLLHWAAQLCHLALYGMLLLLPVLGLAVSQAHDVGVNLFGSIGLPRLIDADPDLADALTDYHIWAAWGLLALVVAHAGAACWHHLVRRDGVLAAMLPWVKRRLTTQDEAGTGAAGFPDHQR